MFTDYELRTKVMKKLDELIALARRHYDNDRLWFGAVKFDINSARTLGQANPRGMQMRFNMPVLRVHSEDYLNTTVPHELAHIITFQLYPRAKAHGKEWKSVMRVLGAEPNRCSNLKISDIEELKTPSRKEVKCDCQTHLVSTRLYNNIVLRGKKYTCKKCKTNIVAC